jgi:hypothetical protein
LRINASRLKKNLKGFQRASPLVGEFEGAKPPQDVNDIFNLERGNGFVVEEGFKLVYTSRP